MTPPSQKPPIHLNCIRLLAAAGGTLLLVACGQTRFYPYVGANVQEGKGIAARRVINGIDVWSDGTPPRKYEVIGVVYDSRSGFFRDSILNDVTRAAKRMGGQGVLEYQGYAPALTPGLVAVSGASGNMGSSSQFGTGIATSAAYGGAAAGALSSAGTGQSRWWVIRYLPSRKRSDVTKAR